MIFICMFSDVLYVDEYLFSCIKVFPTAHKILINIHIYKELQYLIIHGNIICYVISERLGNCWGKTFDPYITLS